MLIVISSRGWKWIIVLQTLLLNDKYANLKCFFSIYYPFGFISISSVMEAVENKVFLSKLFFGSYLRPASPAFLTCPLPVNYYSKSSGCPLLTLLGYTLPNALKIRVETEIGRVLLSALTRKNLRCPWRTWILNATPLQRERKGSLRIKWEARLDPLL